MKQIIKIGLLAMATISMSSCTEVNAKQHNNDAVEAAKCTGSSNCRACKNCNYCKHCNASKSNSCGVCR